MEEVDEKRNTVSLTKKDSMERGGFDSLEKGSTMLLLSIRDAARPEATSKAGRKEGGQCTRGNTGGITG